ncbi:hypothetical protein DUNSADRAFT_8128 [Dunaliella salina]|uniref:Uncharacterized protein n=1 Tax=Dunaliella salina TaxID=3046 RepID=A0ABQ7GK64_DUNSA|nr:hypothetical protein DUNSADRAFT_8128 [Dunaliella salina]|eukprot:KAF5834940.1 hypothetical protein DUNSADRAFT_8128 [Dunaliella salina]
MAGSEGHLLKRIELEPKLVEAGGNNSLHLLAAIPNPQNGKHLVKMIIASGVDPNVPNQVGDYPLHIAARVGSNEVCQALLDGGADALRRNGKNRRPREVPKIPDHTRLLLTDAEEAAKKRKADRDSALWDEKMLATQTQNACASGVV